jgi:glycosyltransferase involved in cell wall biosynthesis
VKPLWVAFACAPGRGSEPGLGYRLTVEVARHVRSLVVLTASHNRGAIEKGAALPANVTVEYVPAPDLRGEFGHRLSYLVWLARALWRARELHAREPFDLVHHVTYAMSWIPPLPGRLGVPFIWNAGNTLGTPMSFLSARHLRGSLAEVTRNLVVAAGWRISRRLVRADAVTLGHPSRDLGCRPFFLPALDPAELADLSPSRDRPRNTGLRVVSVGRLLYLKGIHLAVEAFARVARPDWEYLVIGAGPEEPRLRCLARQLGVGNRVRFLGWLPRVDVLDLLTRCDVFCLPSLHDSFSWAVLEAMAAGLPVVCLDRGGPGLVVDERVGVKLAARGPRQVVADLARALRALADDAQRRSAMGEAARQLVLERHTWDVRAREIVSLYEDVLRLRCGAVRDPAGAGALPAEESPVGRPEDSHE